MKIRVILSLLSVFIHIAVDNAFTTIPSVRKNHHPKNASAPSVLGMGYGRSSPTSGGERTKRQERVGHLVRVELSRIIHTGNVKGKNAVHLDDELRKRISVVNVDVSPDLRQARVSVSVRRSSPEDADVDRRRAFSWLVKNMKPLRHTLAQQMSHIKASAPVLSFSQADVAAAVDVMYLIDKIAAGKDQRESVGVFGSENSVPRGIVGGMDFDDYDESEEDWIEDEEDNYDTNDG
mmetsp:Transcript_27909/g.41193  ORF Transcript_27909/g.41193 Transcript_27909/m.41193 type:complete len:235 (-) Transcript_27909:172-876(-)